MIANGNIPISAYRRFALVAALALAGSTVSVAQDAVPHGDGTGAAPAGEQPDADRSSDSGAAASADRPGKVLDLSNPQAAMRAFLLAAQDAAGDHPERIDDAVACLDTSELEAEDREERARSLASRLHTIMEKHGVTLDDVPVEPESATYLFLEIKDDDTGESIGEISLHRDANDGLWRFTPRTLATVPALEDRIVKAAEPAEPAQSVVAAARRSARATMATFLAAMNADPRDLEEAVACLDPTGQDAQAWSVRGTVLTTQLKNVMDKIKVVVLADVPDDPDGPPYVWYTSQTGNIVIARIAESEDKNLLGEWRFTPQTLDALEALYQELEDQAIVQELQAAGIEEQLTFDLWLQRQIPQPLRRDLWALQIWQWLALVALLPLGWVVMVAASGVAAVLLRFWLRRWKIEIESKARRRLARSVGAVAAIVVWYLAFKLLLFPPNVLGVLLRVSQLAVGVTTVWVGYLFVDVLGGYIASSRELQLTRFDDVLIPMLKKILRLIVVLVAVLFVLDWMGQPPKTVLGVLGIGGVALAFAAQDTLGNFFGSITVLFDRPFGIGDWIVIGDVEGTVERVGFRSTRVRTFYNSLVTIPNSKMVNTQVDNYGARRYRRIRVMLSLTYSTPPEKIDAFCEGIRELVRLHPYTRKDYYHVYFNQFAASSLDVLLYVFIQAPDWGTELRERHRFFVDILRLAKRLGVEFAFPTQTVWLQRSRESAPPAAVTIEPGKDDPDRLGIEYAGQLFDEVYGAERPHRAPVVIDRTPLSKRRSDADGSSTDQTGVGRS